MARINVDEQLRADPRFHALCNLHPRHVAMGAVICLWELGQSYWKKNRSLIPIDIFSLSPLADEMRRVGFVEEKPEGIYCRGACERWDFLIKRIEGGKQRAENATRDEHGRFQQTTSSPPADGPASDQYGSRLVQAHQPSSSSSSSPSSSASESSSSLVKAPQKVRTPKAPESKMDTGPTWAAYQEAYRRRYDGHELIRNATVNTQMANFVKRIGVDEAPKVAAFFLTHSDAYYVKQGHPPGLLLKDAEKLRTEWIRGKRITGAQAREGERQDTNVQAMKQFLEEEAKGAV